MSQVFHQARLPQQVDCSALIGIMREVAFPRAQRHIASSGFELGANNLRAITRSFITFIYNL